MSNIVLEINNLSKLYRLGIISNKTISDDLQQLWAKIRGKQNPFIYINKTNDCSKSSANRYVLALNNINLRVKRGERIGIIGRNGAGKSTLLKILSQVTGPSLGNVKIKGRVGSLLEVGTGFHGELTGRENIYMNGTILGMSHKEVSKKLDEIVDFAGIERYLDTPIKRYSSGMTVRLGFAVAAHLEPEILIVDEVLAVGDAEFQKKAIGKMKEVSEGHGRTILFVSHNMSSIIKLCTSACCLTDGKISCIGKVDKVVHNYLNFFEKFNNIKISEIPRQKGLGAIAKFIDCKILNEQNKEVHKLYFNESFSVLLKVKAFLNIAGLSLSLGIESVNGTRILTVLSEDCKKFYKLKAGEVLQVVAGCSNIKLVPGRYSLTLAIRNGKQGVDQVVRCYAFEISEAPCNKREIYSGSWGFLYTKVSWSRL